MMEEPCRLLPRHGLPPLREGSARRHDIATSRQAERDQQTHRTVGRLFDGHRLGQVSGLVDVTAAVAGDVVGEKLQRDRRGNG